MIHKKSLSLLSLVISFIPYLCAQTVEQQVIGTVGETYSNSTSSVQWTLGEAIVDTKTKANIVLTQGFNQPGLNVTGIKESNLDFEITLFPNPTNGILNIKSRTTSDNFAVTVYDVTGKLLLISDFANDESGQLNLGEFLNGVYLITVTSKIVGGSKQFRIIKT